MNKKLRIWNTICVMTLLVLLFSSCNSTIPNANQKLKDAANRMYSEVSISNTSHIYAVLSSFLPGTIIDIRPDYGEAITYNAKVDTYLFLIDDAPGTRFAHPVRYVLLDGTSSALTYSREWLPNVNGLIWDVDEETLLHNVPMTVLKAANGNSAQLNTENSPFVEQSSGHLVFTRFNTEPRYSSTILKAVDTVPNPRKIALLINGGDNVKRAWQSYYNDDRIFKVRFTCGLAFKEQTDSMDSFLEKQGYETIQFNSDAKENSKLPSSYIFSEVNNIASEVHSGDEVLIYCNGHGNKNKAGIALYDQTGQVDFMDYQSLGSAIKFIDKSVKVTYILDCCYSGAAYDVLKTRLNTEIHTATDGDHTTPVGSGLGNGIGYSESIYSDNMQADTNKDGNVTLDEALFYAQMQHLANGAGMFSKPSDNRSSDITATTTTPVSGIGPVPSVLLVTSTTTVNTIATYTVYFTVAVYPASAPAIVLTFPSGANIAGVTADIATSEGLADYIVPGIYDQAATIAISGQNLTIFPPAALGMGTQIRIIVKGVINPATIGNYIVSVHTAFQPIPVASNSFTTTKPVTNNATTTTTTSKTTTTPK